MDKQMSDQSFDIVFVGQDFKPVREAAERAEITYKGEKYYIGKNNEILLKNSAQSDTQNDAQRSSQNDLTGSGESNSTDKRNLQAYEIILEKFLEQVTDRSGAPKSPLFNVNRSENKWGKKKLYSVFSDKLYFSGIVGVIKKQIIVNLDREVRKWETADGEEVSEEENQDSREQQENGKTLTFNVTLQIKSRLDAADKKTPGKPYFLSKMLLRDKIEFSDNNVPESEEELLDYLLLFWFRQQLQEALQKGYYKTYRRFSRNDDKPKGSINVAEHIRLNMGRKNGKIAYTYRENTVSNYLNLLLITAYEHLKKKYYDLVVDNFDNNIELKKTLDFIRREVQGLQADVGTVINRNLKSIAHPYFTEYEQLRITCLKILRDEGTSIFDGNPEDENQSILFYLPDLWELYLRDEMFNQMPEGVGFEDQKKVKVFGKEKEKHSDEHRDGGKEYLFRQETFPDYVFYDTDKTVPENLKYFMVLDAKFKPKWEETLKKGMISDVSEDYDKCCRDMVNLRANCTGVIFPTNENPELNSQTWKHAFSKKYRENSFFYTIPLHVPMASEDITFSEWDEQFAESIERSKSVLNEVLKRERNYAHRIYNLKQQMDEIAKEEYEKEENADIE